LHLQTIDKFVIFWHAVVMATVRITLTALAEIQNLPASIQARVQRVVARLENWPAVSGARPLRGDLAGHYRIRTGDYRVQFHPSDRTPNAIVTVVKVGHRDGFYDD
jgi:mRNA-degrading endonuclease RelE of RelBE toxin-antitoxin system